jgi:hypothetical protein
MCDSPYSRHEYPERCSRRDETVEIVLLLAFAGGFIDAC